MITPAMTTDLPPSMMFCLPSIFARREILLPVSFSFVSNSQSKQHEYQF